MSFTYLTASEKEGKKGKVTTSVLLTCIGEKGREIYETFSFNNPGDEMKLVPELEKLSEYCKPRKNITILPHKFFTHGQHDEQKSHEFATELKKLSSECEFEDLHDSLIKNMIVCGTNDRFFRECLLPEFELTLSTGHAAGETFKHTRENIMSNETIDLHKISKHAKYRNQTSA